MTRAGKRKLSEEQKVGILFAQRCKIAELEADLARMKEALEKIAELSGTAHLDASDDIFDIATQALNHKEG